MSFTRELLDDLIPDPNEVVIERKTGRPRQAGADVAEGHWILGLRKKFEQSLYAFTKGVLQRDYLTPTLHKAGCEFLQKVPPRRKMMLWPREHGKTSIVCHGLPIHILIQPEEDNLYFPGMQLDGSDVRVLVSCETERLAKDSLRVVESAFETNDVLRAFWPHRCWDNPRQQSKKWNDVEMIIPRKTEFPDPSIRAIGVGGAITGAHPLVAIKDDLVTLEAANSPVTMQAAIEWHVASRALMNVDWALEFIIGTRWAVHDLYSYIEQNDPTVEIIRRSAVEDGKPIYPERFDMAKILRLQREFGVLFPLLYMNQATDPSLTDFDMTEVREFEITGDVIKFREDERDALIVERQDAPAPKSRVPIGMPLNRQTAPLLLGRDEFLRLRYG